MYPKKSALHSDAFFRCVIPNTKVHLYAMHFFFVFFFFCAVTPITKVHRYAMHFVVVSYPTQRCIAMRCTFSLFSTQNKSASLCDALSYIHTYIHTHTYITYLTYITYTHTHTHIHTYTHIHNLLLCYTQHKSASLCDALPRCSIRRTQVHRYAMHFHTYIPTYIHTHTSHTSHTSHIHIHIHTYTHIHI